MLLGSVRVVALFLHIVFCLFWFASGWLLCIGFVPAPLIGVVCEFIGRGSF
jgi:hypothetical protein